MDERRVGEGDPERPYRLFSALSELRLRFCQNRRGDVVPFSRGEDWNGEESVARPSFCCCAVSLLSQTLRKGGSPWRAGAS